MAKAQPTGKGKWEWVPAIGRRVWVEEPAEEAEEPTGAWESLALSPDRPHDTRRLWVPRDQSLPTGVCGDGSGEYVYHHTGKKVFIPAHERMRRVVTDRGAELCFVPHGMCDYDFECDRGEWITAGCYAANGQPIEIRAFRLFDEADRRPDPAAARGEYLTGAAACRSTGRSLSWLRRLALQGEVRTTLSGRRVLYHSGDVGLAARGGSPRRQAEAQAEARQEWARSQILQPASQPVPQSQRDLPDAGRSFVERFGASNGF